MATYTRILIVDKILNSLVCCVIVILSYWSKRDNAFVEDMAVCTLVFATQTVCWLKVTFGGAGVTHVENGPVFCIRA